MEKEHYIITLELWVFDEDGKMGNVNTMTIKYSLDFTGIHDSTKEFLENKAYELYPKLKEFSFMMVMIHNHGIERFLVTNNPKPHAPDTPKPNNGGPAFPRPRTVNPLSSATLLTGQAGMSKRFWAATQITKGFASDPELTGKLPDIIGSAYDWADELIKQEEK